MFIKALKSLTVMYLVIHDADNTVDPIELKKIVEVLVEKTKIW